MHKQKLLKAYLAVGLILALVILGSQVSVAAPTESGSSGVKYFNRYTVSVFIPSCCPRSHFYAGIDNIVPIRVTVADKRGKPVSGLSLGNFIVMADETVLTVDLAEVSPGSYEGSFDISPLGVNYSGHAVKILVIREQRENAKKLFVLGQGSMSLKVVGAGDINADGAVNMNDYYILAYAMGSSYGDIDYIPAADINHDHVIDAVDRFILDYFWGMQY